MQIPHFIEMRVEIHLTVSRSSLTLPFACRLRNIFQSINRTRRQSQLISCKIDFLCVDLEEDDFDL